MALEGGDRPLEIEPNYSELLLPAEIDYQTALIFCIS